MARVHLGIVSERKQHRPNRSDQNLIIAAGQIRPANRAGEECVADEKIFSGRSLPADLQADPARAMSRRVVRPRFAVTERNDLPRRVEGIDGRQRIDMHTEHRSLLRSRLVQKQILAMEVHRRAEGALGHTDAGDMIDVRMRQQNVPDGQGFRFGKRQQAGHFITGIDDDRLARLIAGDDEAVFEERPDSLRFNYDHAVILAILDDLMFTSKIKTAASQLGVAVAFARSSDAALAEMRQRTPSLVIFDLNSTRTDPLGTVAAMKRDAGLASIPTLGFVSHVQAELIDAARQAGVEEVLARSAFTMRLPEILRRP